MYNYKINYWKWNKIRKPSKFIGSLSFISKVIPIMAITQVTNFIIKKLIGDLNEARNKR